VSPDVVVDIGNTRIKWGRVCDGRLTDAASLDADDVSAWQRQATAWADPACWVLAGVQPQTRARLAQWLTSRGHRAHVLDSFRQLPICLKVEAPEKVGLDRLLDAVAVNTRRAAGHGAVIIDAGTAVTVDLLDASGVFRGGAIMPGLRLMAEALHRHTALLPLVVVAERVDPPGASTIPAIGAGVFHSVLGGIESLARTLRAQCDAPCEFYLGGGDARLLAPNVSFPAQVWQTMTLEGILRSAEALA
jgi:type III pantothenate kinase